MQNTVFGENCSINCIITDKNVVITNRRCLCGCEKLPYFIQKGTMIDNNIQLLQMYIDPGVSAFHNSLKDRPQGKFVLEHIYNKDIDCVIAISDDRMFRNAEDSIVVNNFADKNGVKLIYTRQIHYLNMDPYSSFITKIFTIKRRYI